MKLQANLTELIRNALRDDTRASLRERHGKSVRNGNGPILRGLPRISSLTKRARRVVCARYARTTNLLARGRDNRK